MHVIRNFKRIVMNLIIKPLNRNKEIVSHLYRIIIEYGNINLNKTVVFVRIRKNVLIQIIFL